MTNYRGTRLGRGLGKAARRKAPLAGVLALTGGTVLAVLTGCSSGGGAQVGAPQVVPGTAGPADLGQTTSGADASSMPESGGTSNSAEVSAPPAPNAAGTPGSAGSPPSSSVNPPSTGGTTVSSRCHTSELQASVGPNHPGAGQENFALILTNRSGRTCTVHGFPGMAFVNSAGQQVSTDPERTSVEKTTVSLAPGKSAWAPMTFGNPEITGVPTVTPAYILITPPDEKASLKVHWTGGPVSRTGAASVPRLSPFLAGTGA